MADGNPSFTVGVVIPTYNYAHGLGRAIESVLAQTRPPEEIVVVNDGSTDGTLDVVASFGDRVRCVTQANRGAAAARNAGVKELRTDWAAFLDQDDEWLPEKLERQCAALGRVPQAAFGCTGAHVCRNGERAGVFLPDEARIARGFRYRNCFGSASSYMIRRDAFLSLGGFREAQQTYAEDWELAVRLYLRYPFCAVPEPLICYLDSSTGASSKALEMMRAELGMVESPLLDGLTGADRYLARRRLLAEIHFRAARNTPRPSCQRVRMIVESLRNWPLPLESGSRLRTLASDLRSELRARRHGASG